MKNFHSKFFSDKGEVLVEVLKKEDAVQSPEPIQHYVDYQYHDDSYNDNSYANCVVM